MGRNQNVGIAHEYFIRTFTLYVLWSPPLVWLVQGVHQSEYVGAAIL